MTRYQHFDPYPFLYPSHLDCRRMVFAEAAGLLKLPMLANPQCQGQTVKHPLEADREKSAGSCRKNFGSTVSIPKTTVCIAHDKLPDSCPKVLQSILNWLNCCKLRQESKSELSEQTATNEVYLVTTWNSVPWRDMDMLTCWDSGVLIRKNKIKTNTSRCST